jgi:signal transduction histidine kinase/CheY-like chemotaxis protein
MNPQATDDTGGLSGLSFGTRELLEGIGVPALVTSPQRVALWANAPFCELFGVEGGPSALIGQPVTELARRVSGEFREPERFLAGIVSALDGGVPVAGEVLEHTDGRMVSRAYYPIRVDGDIIAHMWRYDDVTEVHRRGVALARSGAVLEAMVRAHGPAVRHATAREVFSNLLDGLIELSGSEYGFIGEIDRDENGPFLRSWAISDIAWDTASRDFFQTAMRERGYLEFHELESLYGVTLLTGEMVISNDPVHDPRSFGLPPGHPPLGSYLGVPIRLDGHLLGMAGLAGRPDGYDADVVEMLQPLITACASMIEAYSIERERRVAEEATRAALEAAERANAAKTQLLGRVSHELRTPLNAVLGFAQLLGRNEPDERRARWIAQIEEAGQHVLAQVEDLLDLAAAESGHLSLELAPVDLDRVVAAVCELLAPLATERSVSMSHSRSGEWAVADEGRLRVVLINLVSNAVKYNVAGGSVQVDVQSLDDTVRIVVADDGPGIPAEKFEQAFLMFERLDGAGKGVPGAGLGLAIAREYAQAMGGRLEGRPRPGGGAELWVTLPRAPRDATGEAPVPTDYSKPWVLCVEDNAMNAEVIVEFLGESDDVHVEVVETLAAARAALARRTPALVLLDLNLPDGNGSELAEELFASGSDVPVVLVTADAFAASDVAARLPELHGTLLKPLRFDLVAEMVGTALHRAD